MKSIHNKFLLVVAILFSITNLFAQDLTTAKGELILPQAKDWGLSIDATKLIKGPGFDYLTSVQSISAKYFKNAQTAYRFGFRVGLNNWTSKAYATDRAAVTSSVVAYPAIVAVKENKWSRNSMALGLSYGVEKRRGSTRLQGIYGVEVGFYVSSTRDRFTYGNKLDPLSTTAPVTVDTLGDAMSSPVFGRAGNVDPSPSIQGVQGAARAVDRKNGLTFSLGARGFIGGEFFPLPRLSVGGEFGWGLGFSMSGRSETIWESAGETKVPGVQSTPTTVKKTTVDGPQSFKIGLDNDNGSIFGGTSATLRVNIYF